jgi:serine/threonine protein kinase
MLQAIIHDEEKCGWRDTTGPSCLFDNDVVLMRKLTHSGHSEDPELSCAGGVAVFRGQLRSCNKLVAVKVSCKCNAHKKRKSFLSLCGEDSEDQLIIGFNEDLEQEKRMLQVIRSDHVVELVKSCEDSRFRYLVTEYLPGGDLFDFISKDPRGCQENIAKDMAFQLFKGLRDLHEAGVAHLDISLENIVIGYSANQHLTVKLIDFGRSRSFVKGRKYMLSRCRGKSNFRPMEIAYAKATVPFSVDCFSAGVVLFCLLFGRFPFTSADVSDEDYLRIYHNRTSSVIERAVSDLHAVISNDCKNVLEILLCPEEKRSSAAELLNHQWFKSIQEG